MMIKPSCKLASQIFVVLSVFALASGARAAERYWVYHTTGGYLDSSPAIGDVDRDGSPDVVVTSTVGPVFALDGHGHEIWRTDLHDPISVSPTLADVCGDPGLEVLALTQTGRIVCLEGLTGDIVWENKLLGEVKWGAMTIIVADLEHNGHLDILAADRAGTLVCLDGHGKLLWTYKEPEGIGSALAVGDLDGDGKAEIVFATEDTPLVCLDCHGKLRWRMTEKTRTWATRSHKEVSAPVIWDLKGNGHPEILVGIGKSLAAVSGKGKLLWTYPMANQIDSAISVADTNHDGKAEIYVADLSGKFACVSAAGKGEWTAQLGDRARRSPTIADVNGDGVPDILAAGYSEFLSMFDPHGKVEERLRVDGGTNASATIADLNGDGGLCAVIPEISGNLVVYRWKPVIKKPLVLWPQYRYNAVRTASAFPTPKRVISEGVEDVKLGNYYAKSSAFSIRFVNPSHKRLSLHLTVSGNGARIAERRTSSSRRHITVKLPYKTDSLPGTKAQFQYVVCDGYTVVARQTYSVKVFPFTKTYDRIRSELDHLDALRAKMPDPRGIAEQACYLRAQADKLAKRVEAVATASKMDQRALRDDLTSLNAAISRPLTLAEQAVKEGKVLVVYAANPWAPFGGMDEIVEKRTPAPVAGSDATDTVEAFQGEIKSAAFNVFNFGADPLTLRVTVDPLAQTGAPPSSGAITLREVIAVPTQRGDKSADALPRLGEGQTLVVPAWRARQLWLTIDTGKLAPGAWRSKVHFRSLDVVSKQSTANVDLTVWNTKLPAKKPIRFCNWTDTSDPKDALKDLIAHGTNVFTDGVPAIAKFNKNGDLIGKIDFKAQDAYMKTHAPYGVILFNSWVSLGGPAPAFSPVWQKAYTQFIHAWIKHLAKLGFGYDSFALYPVDEPGGDDGRRVAIFMKWAKATDAADPKVRMYADAPPPITMDELKQMLPYVDIWAPLQVSGWAKDMPDKLALMHSTKAEEWNYSCANNAKHQSPLGYYRAQAWMVWCFGHTGIGIYRYHQNGDADWFYQTADYDMIYGGDRVVTSKRWEAVRDGIDDYTMLYALRAAATAPGADPKAAEAARKVYEDQAKTIGKFCNWGPDGTVPGKGGMPAARTLADKQWRELLQVRRAMAAAFDQLRHGRH